VISYKTKSKHRMRTCANVDIVHYLKQVKTYV